MALSFEEGVATLIHILFFNVIVLFFHPQLPLKCIPFFTRIHAAELDKFTCQTNIAGACKNKTEYLLWTELLDLQAASHIKNSYNTPKPWFLL